MAIQTRVTSLRSTASFQEEIKVAYIMSRFPKITETFILFEMAAVEQLGVKVALFPLWMEHTNVVHPKAQSFVERAHFTPFLSKPILTAHLHYIRRKPRVYLKTLWTLLRANWGSMRYFSGAVAIFPKVVYFARLMEGEGINHVHAHFASHPAAAAYVIQQLSGIPYSFTAHGSDLHRDRHMLCEKVKDAAFVVAISEFNKQIILAECGNQYQDKVVVIHCGVDTRVFQPRVERELTRVSDRPFMILCIGTLHEVKGQMFLIQACKLLKESGIDFTCHLVGDGPDEERLKKQANQAGLSQRVHFHGRLTQGDVRDLLLKTDVLTAPSVPTRNGRREGIPVVLMEAMSSNVPVIASAISGIPELVQDEKSGLLIPPGDAFALANALERIYRDAELRNRFSRWGREEVLDEFDLYKNAAILARHFHHEVVI